MQVRSRSHRRNRTKTDPAIQPKGLDPVATVSLEAGKMRLTFNAPVNVVSLPQTITVNSLKPTSFTVISALVVDLEFATVPVSEDTWEIGLNDPAIRSGSGGYAAPATGTFP